ncbi:hypothetical protein SLEP1_g10538 [Rubroshorea leprosula]|uniref:non-specific serine/threonine protein kinase n=1 Tax=Rubroshorea leprosula TaxID=152421 RepID=A0AAV5IJR3_9ROSI|nr:hypothetical protein SLEP1_g10538 [Rubroshorea leprosula]
MSLQNFFKFLKKTLVKERERKPSALSEGLCRQFSLAELKAATNNFDDDLKIGEGGFGPVYKGLVDDGSLVVAVKRLARQSELRAEPFQNEVQVLCQLRHQNLVSLLGFCHEKGESILMYEYVTHGGLNGHLFKNDDPLPWKRRLEICIGAARGLHYLHTGAKYAIIHFDVKPHNILLNENWDAKLSDFGLSLIGPSSFSKPKPNAWEGRISTARGTLGYMAPEVLYKNLGFSEKVDVYSLGLVLIEVLCGRKMVDAFAEDDDFIYLISGIIKCIKNGCVHDIIDPFLKGKIAPVCLIEYKTSVKERGRKPSALSEGLCRQFSLAELKAATNNFDDDLKIGEGGFGPVYKGLIDGGSLVVAVKRLNRSTSSGQGVEAFRNEVELLCQLRHQNLVCLLGLCHEKDERILVYEHMTHRSLDRHVFGNADPLPWKRRLEICIGAARGLHYIHTGAKYAIIHRDVKPHNILLNENWDAKLSDFGLSLIGPSSFSKPKPNAWEEMMTSAKHNAWEEMMTSARVTLGYMAGEMFYKNLGFIRRLTPSQKTRISFI